MSGRIPPRHPVAYLTVRSELPRRLAWPRLLHAIRCELADVELTSYGTVFASQEDDQARAPRVISSSAGLVITGSSGYIGPGIAREIRLAMAAQLPIIVLARRGLVALADCRIEPLRGGERRPWRELRILLPPVERPSAALRASLRAMGARRSPGGASRRRL